MLRGTGRGLVVGIVGCLPAFAAYAIYGAEHPRLHGLALVAFLLAPVPIVTSLIAGFAGSRLRRGVWSRRIAVVGISAAAIPLLIALLASVVYVIAILNPQVMGRFGAGLALGLLMMAAIGAVPFLPGTIAGGLVLEWWTRPAE